MKKGKVVLGMSGGVDSSVAAFLLRREGYEVIGYFMNCGPRGKTMWPSSINWKEDERILRKICKKVGVKELITADCELGYEKKIIGPMFEDYKKGLTPNPDILCNNVGKFPNLIRIAKEKDADFIATGHYARTKNGKLYRGKDSEKDQSYFIAGLDKKTLKKCLFPIGEYTKVEVRKIARRNKFVNWDKRGSRGVCYLGKIDMKKFLRERIKEKKGKVLSHEGEVVGSHNGVMFFTIGERVRDSKGIKVEDKFRRKFPGRLFIAEKKRGNVLVIAPQGHEILRRKKVYIKDLKWINKEEGKGLRARIRHLGLLEKGRLRKENWKKGVPPTYPKRFRWTFVFDKGVEGVAEGQFIVLYKGERVVGSGEIRLR